MKIQRLVLVATLVSGVSAVTFAQDPLKVDAAHYKLVFENASVRVLRVGYGPGEKSPMHQHPDSTFVALAASKVRFTLPDGKAQDQDMANEAALYLPAGTHSPANIGSTRVDGVLVEYKTPAPGKAVLPNVRTDISMKLLAEGPRAAAYRSTAAATFHEPAGASHDFDQVVIALGAVKMSLSIDGRPAKTTWARGDAEFIPRGIKHESKNESGGPVDFVIVQIR